MRWLDSEGIISLEGGLFLTTIRIILLALLVSVATFGTAHAASLTVKRDSELPKSWDSLITLVVDGVSQTTLNIATLSSEELHYVVTPETQKQNRLYAFSNHKAAQSFLNNSIKIDDVSVQSGGYIVYWDSETTSYAGSSLTAPGGTSIANLGSIGWNDRITSSQMFGTNVLSRISRGTNFSESTFIGVCPLECHIVWEYYKAASSLKV